MYGGGRGPQTKAAGGFALKHSVDFNVMMKSLAPVKDDGGNVKGCSVSMLCEKNRVVGNRNAVMFLKYGIGFSNVATMVDMVKRKYGTMGGAYCRVKIPDLSIDENLHGNQGLNDFVSKNFDGLALLFNREDVLADYFAEVTSKRDF
jgi:hypothetical protein